MQLGSGVYSGLGFTAVSDGAAGTDIIVGAQVLTYSWVGPSADWRTATNWSSGVIPGTTANATIANVGSNTVTISSAESIAVAGVALSNGNTLDVAGTLAPSATIGISGALLSVTAGGLITGAATGTLIGGTGVVNNAGTITAGGRYGLNLTGTVSNQGSINATVDATTVVNRGTISNTTANATGVIGTNGAFAEVINGTSGGTNALIAGANTGVNLNGGSSGGTVVNYGTVIGTNFLGVDLFASGGTVGLSNYGTILAGGSSLAYAAVHVASAAIINNTGVIKDTAAGVAGVYVRSNPGVTNIGLNLSNSGLITAAGHAIVVNSEIPAVVTNSGTLIGSEAFSVFSTVATSQTLIDSGTIIGTSGTAAVFGAGNDLLRFVPSTSVAVQGTVDGGAGANTLGVCSPCEAAGTLTGNNAVFTGFSGGTVDSGAVWTLAGNISFASNVTITNSGTLTGIGSLSNAGLISGAAAVEPGGDGNVAVTIATGSLRQQRHDRGRVRRRWHGWVGHDRRQRRIGRHGGRTGQRRRPEQRWDGLWRGRWRRRRRKRRLRRRCRRSWRYRCRYGVRQPHQCGGNHCRRWRGRRPGLGYRCQRRHRRSWWHRRFCRIRRLHHHWYDRGGIGGCGWGGRRGGVRWRGRCRGRRCLPRVRQLHQ